jgi:hypothetical protein
LAKAIQDSTYNLTDLCNFGDKLLLLRYPYIGQKDAERFNLVQGTSSSQDEASGRGKGDTPVIEKPVYFQYYGRAVLKEIYQGVLSLSVYCGYKLYYVHGTLGYGKSFLLAALAIALFKDNRRVVYLPHCKALARSFFSYLRDGLALTYAYFNDHEALRGCFRCTTASELVNWCLLRSYQAETLYFIVDQINALDTDIEVIDSVPIARRQECTNMLGQLEFRHILIYSSSGNYLHGYREDTKPEDLKRVSVFGGLPKVSQLSLLSSAGPNA